MKKNNYPMIIITIFILVVFLASCKQEKIKNEIVLEDIIEEDIKAKIYDEDKESNVIAKNVDTPNESSIVTNLPWANNTEFLIKQQKYETDVLLAAYCTVLKDPLPGEEYNVHLAANNLAGTVIEKGEVFSQNKRLGPYVESKGYRIGPTYIGNKLTTTVGGGVCKISSTLYNVSVLSNLEIVERYNHSMPVPYVPYGQDATVSYGSKDFKFRNNTEFPILIWSEGVGNRLYIGFYGKEKPPNIEWNHNIKQIVEAPKQYMKNTSLNEGEEKILVEGMNGATVESWVTIEYPDGTTKTRKLGTSYYKPMPYLIEINK